jgi:hypothetical protein
LLKNGALLVFRFTEDAFGFVNTTLAFRFDGHDLTSENEFFPGGRLDSEVLIGA